jgi:aconitase A
MSTKNRYAFFKGKIVPIEEAKVSIMTSAFNYGTGSSRGSAAIGMRRRSNSISLGSENISSAFCGTAGSC